jgi:hypothetical protein
MEGHYPMSTSEYQVVVYNVPMTIYEGVRYGEREYPGVYGNDVR